MGQAASRTRNSECVCHMAGRASTGPSHAACLGALAASSNSRLVVETVTSAWGWDAGIVRGSSFTQFVVFILCIDLLSDLLLAFVHTESFFTSQNCRSNEEVTLIRKADLENHNKDGGFWTVIDGKVYDIKDFQTQSLTGNSILGEDMLFFF